MIVAPPAPLENFPEPPTRGFYGVRTPASTLICREMLGTAVLDIEHSPEPAQVHRLGVRGELDAETAPGLVSALRSARGATHLRVDLSGVTFIDASGLSALIRVLNEARSAGVVVEVGQRVSAPVRRIIQLTHTRRQIWP